MFEELNLALLHLYKTKNMVFQFFLKIMYLIFITLGNKYT